MAAYFLDSPPFREEQRSGLSPPRPHLPEAATKQEIIVYSGVVDIGSS